MIIIIIMLNHRCHHRHDVVQLPRKLKDEHGAANRPRHSATERRRAHLRVKIRVRLRARVRVGVGVRRTTA